MAACEEMTCAVSAAVSEGQRRPCAVRVEVAASGGAGRDFFCLTFRNHFAAYASVRQLVTAPGADGGRQVWRTVLKDVPLMADPHCEDDAEEYHTVTADALAAGGRFEPDDALRLRVYLWQPSPLWREVAIRDVRMWRLVPAAADGKGGAEEEEEEEEVKGREEEEEEKKEAGVTAAGTVGDEVDRRAAAVAALLRPVQQQQA